MRQRVHASAGPTGASPIPDSGPTASSGPRCRSWSRSGPRRGRCRTATPWRRVWRRTSRSMSKRSATTTSGSSRTSRSWASSATQCSLACRRRRSRASSARSTTGLSTTTQLRSSGICVHGGLPPSPELIAELKARTGYPAEAFRTLEEHGELDVGHRSELNETIDALPLTRDHEEVLGLCVLSGMISSLDRSKRYSIDADWVGDRGNPPSLRIDVGGSSPR